MRFFLTMAVKTVKLAMKNVYTLFLGVFIGNIHLFKPLKRNIVLIVITPPICIVTIPFLKYCTNPFFAVQFIA